MWEQLRDKAAACSCEDRPGSLTHASPLLPKARDRALRASSSGVGVKTDPETVIVVFALLQVFQYTHWSSFSCFKELIMSFFGTQSQ